MNKYFQKAFSYLNQTELSVLFFLLFIFLLPFKRRLEMLTDYSFLDSKFMDYLTISFYGFEIFLILALVFWVITGIRKKEKFFLGNKKIFFSILALFIFSLFSCFFATSKIISFYYIIVLLEAILLYLFVVNKINDKKNIFVFLNTFLFSTFLQCLIGILQFFKNGSLGLYSFGESILSPSINDVAKIIFNGTKHIRAYGTFPHANVLALFIITAGMVNLYLFFNARDKKYKAYLIAVLIVLLIALVITFSRIIWVLAAVLWGLYIFKNHDLKNKIKKFFWKKDFKTISIFFLLTCLLAYLLIFLAPAIWWRINPVLATTWDSWASREVVLEKSLVLFKNHWWGIGMGSFLIGIAYQLTNYPLWMVEPAHNTFLMVLVELGALGFLSFISLLVFIFKTFKTLPLYLKYLFCSLFIYMFFDHCFWDIRQVQILLFLFIGLISVYSSLNQKAA